MEVKWIERSASNVEHAGLNLQSCGHSVRTLTKSIMHSCSATSIFCHMVMSALLNYGRVQCYMVIVLYCKALLSIDKGQYVELICYA